MLNIVNCMVINNLKGAELKIFFILTSLFFVGCNSSEEKTIESEQANEISNQLNEINSTVENSSNLLNTLPNQVVLGIESISKKRDIVEINVYALNDTPIAGVQFELNPDDIFQIDSIAGGRCSNIDFTLRSNPKGLMLGFSMSGKMIPVSTSKVPSQNILFTAYGKTIKNVKNRNITLESTIAGKGGVKLDVSSIPYLFTGE